MEKRCFSCMKINNNNICDSCGFDSTQMKLKDNDCLRLGTLIENRYYIGVPIDKNGEGITYKAYDITEDRCVRIREFFPGEICTKDANGKISIIPGCEIKYKTLGTDFIELSEEILKIKGNHSLLKAKQIVTVGISIYAVYEDVIAVTLRQYLANIGGRISWDDVENLFLPILYTLKLLHSNNIIHRGVSLDTILVTNNNELKLTGLCISAVRASSSEIQSELFAGYSAPEQYQNLSSHGDWTDVYSVCSVLYKTLTASVLPIASNRNNSTSLISPRAINKDIPMNVSNAIIQGLEVDKSSRIQNMNRFMSMLYSKDNEPHSAPEDKKIFMPKKKKFKLPIWLIVVFVTLPLMLTAFFIAYNGILGNKKSPVDTLTSSIGDNVDKEIDVETESKPDIEVVPVDKSSSDTKSESAIEDEKPRITVPNFTGLDYKDVYESEIYKQWFNIAEPEKVFDDLVSVGQIISQDVEFDTVVEKGKTIKFKVSQGSKLVDLPPIIDSNGNSITADSYKEYLEGEGVIVKISEIEALEFVTGDIVRISPNDIKTLDRSKNNIVTIFVAR